MSKIKAAKPNATPSAAVIVFGLDASGKPKAGRFPGKNAAVARKAAKALKLAICRVNRPSLIEIAAKVPVGRLHSQGKAFLPYIARGLYDALVAGTEPAAARAAAAKPAPNKTMDPPAKPPKDHASIAVGDLVLCTEGPKEGYWECIVTERDGDNLVCRFRDYPRLPSFKSTIQAVALMHCE
jgi:hypothetical protein